MTLLLVVFAGLVTGAVAERLVAPDGPLARGPVEPRPGQPVLPGRPARRPRRRRGARSWIARGALVSVVLLLVALVGGYLWAQSIFDRIDKVDVSSALSGSSGTNYLLVGADNSLGGGEQREGVEGVRSDTIMVLHVEGGKAQMLSLNRDLWITNPATGQPGRLNASYNQGPENLVRAVTQNFGIPIERYIEIDFDSFSGLVDSFGGIDVHFEHPAFDLGSGLDVKQAGLVHLDGAQALAYVRSRHYTEVVDGQPRPEGGLPDVNRTVRQQTFLREIMNKASDNKNPFKLMSAGGKMADGLRIDDDMSMLDAARFAWSMGSLDPQPVALPVVPRTTSGGAAVLELGPGAEDVLAQFR